MMRLGRFTTLASLTLALVATGHPARTAMAVPRPPEDAPRRLTFDQRIEAQRAIERIYHAGRIGGAPAFEAAVPRPLLERKVRTYLSQSVALERLWKSPITSTALRRELERIAANTRFPDRLTAIYEALDNDSFLIQETLVRSALADRLARGFFSAEAADGPRQDWETWWEDVEPEFDPALVHEVAGRLRKLPEPGPRAGKSGLGPSLDAVSGGADGAASPCDLEDIWGSGAADVPPAPRSGHTAVWTGSEMIVWGGGYLDTGARYDPLTDTWRPTPQAGAPAGRIDHTAVWTGSEMIVWGGSSLGTVFTTGGRYDPVANAWTATSLADAPSTRYHHTAVWTGHEMIVWGGWTGSGTRINTGGRYDPGTDTWSATSPVDAPTLGLDHAAVWTGSEMIVWGGSSTSAGGVYNPATDKWRPTSLLDAPSQRRLSTAVWTGTEMIVWGGSGGGFAPGGGRYNPATDKWRPTNPDTAPLNRYHHTALWTGSRMIVWGGEDFSHNPPSAHVNTGALYDPVGDTWMPTSLADAPTPRGRHSAVWADGRMIVWGGTGNSSGGRYDVATDSWTPTNSTPSSPSQRAAHTTVWTGSEMIVWGGTTDRSGGRYDPLLDAWTPTPLVNAPSPRFYHTAVWTGRVMIVWGGEDIGGELDTGGRYDPLLDTWSPTSMVDAPSARAYHTATWTGSKMIVWGGDVGDYLKTNTGGRYDPALDTWAATSLTDAPSARAYHTAVWTGRDLIVWGGDEGVDPGTVTGGRYNPASDTWSPTSPVNAPSARAYHTAVWTGRDMIVWGGYGGVSLNTGGRYNPLADVWTPTPTAGAPFGRLWHTAVWTGREMIVWGGAYDDFLYIYSTNTGGRYDPAAEAWTPTTRTNAPESRNLHTAVWIGTAMIVRGGELNTGDVIYLARDPKVAWYGAAAAVPSPDSDGDGYSVCAADCDDADAAVYPGATQYCGDGRNNDCSHPAWPSLAGTNESDDDADGLSECAGDCTDADGTAWSTPAEVPGFEVGGSDPALLTWNAPAGGGAVRYDALRSAIPGDFQAGAVCVESDDPSDTSASDAGMPVMGGILFYLVRAENSCPGALGTGPLGFTSSGAPRQGRSCP